ncbi:RNA polymerase II elongation factor ELL2-like [Nyctibius grandis]
MAKLREGERYSVSGGREKPSVTVMRVKLPEAVLQALASHQGCKDDVSSQHLIQFQGSQGLIKIPKVDQPNEVHTFDFRLSDVGKDNPQGSVDCVRQRKSSSGVSQLICLGVIENKITVRAASDFYQTSRKRMTQAEEESRNQGAKVIKPDGPLLEKRGQVRSAPQSNPDVAPERKRSTPINPANLVRRTSTHKAVSQRPYRDRVIHLLALRNYKKLELLFRLQRDGVNKKDRNCLGTILRQVAILNPKDNSYSLKDYLFKDIQKDWPGYNELDKQSLELILSRKLNSSQNATSTSHLASPALSDKGAPSTSSQKRPVTSNFIDPVMNKKRRIGHLSSRTEPSFRGCFLSISEKATAASLHKEKDESNAQDTTSASKEEKDLTKEETDKLERSSPSDSVSKLCFSVGVNETCTASTAPPSSSEQPDYFIKYTAIVSYDQRRSYEHDFNAEYGEYRNLHARIESTIRKFMKFKEQWKLVSPESKEYQILQEEILEEYRKIKESIPSYYEEKHRCEYLHHKLSHIKRLIAEFDEKQAEIWRCFTKHQ